MRPWLRSGRHLLSYVSASPVLWSPPFLSCMKDMGRLSSGAPGTRTTVMPFWPWILLHWGDRCLLSTFHFIVEHLTCMSMPVLRALGITKSILFGSSTPLPRDGHFHAVHGGLVKFLPRHQAPIWQGSFVDKLGSAASWRSLPSLPQCPPDPFCAVGCPGSGPLVGLRDLSPPQSTDLAAFLGYAPSDITCMQPSHGMLQNVCASAVEAAAVVAVFPSPPPPGRTTMPVILYFWTAGRLAVRLRLSGSGTRLFP